MGVWNEEQDKYVHEVREITDAGYKCLFLPCRFEENVTLRQFLILLRKHDDVLGKIFEVFHYEEFMDFLINSNHKNLKVEAIEVYKNIGIDKKSNDLYTDRSTHLCSFPLTQAQIDSKSEAEKAMFKEGDIENFAFIGIKDLDPDMKIKVRPKTHISIQDENGNDENPLILDDERGLTLMDIIYALFWSFSFFGDMEQQEKFEADLIKSAEEIENGTAITYELKKIDGEYKFIGPDGQIESIY